MQMYDGAAAQLEGGVDWSLSGKTFALLLLKAGPTTFNSADATITAVLANARNTAETTVRERVEATTEVTDLGVRYHIYAVTRKLYHSMLGRHSGVAVIYEDGADDDNRVPIGMIRPGEIRELIRGTTLRVPMPLHVESIGTRVKTLEDDAILANAGLAVSATATKFKTTKTLVLREDEIQFAKVPEDLLVFSENYTINTAAGVPLVFGAFLVQSTKYGVISTKAVSANQVYTSAALAIAALPAADAGNTAIGYIVIGSKASTAWTANTDDMTAASDVQSVVFTSYGNDVQVADGKVLQHGDLQVTADTAKFKTVKTIYFQNRGIQFSDAATDNLAFTAAHTINTGAATGFFFGAILVQVSEAGTISTKVVGADQVYASAALAVAALPAADAANVAIGHIVIGANENLAWTGQTDDLVPASDALTVVFVNYGPNPV